MIKLHDNNTGTEVWYNPNLITQVFKDPGSGKTFVLAGVGGYVRESVEEVLKRISSPGQAAPVKKSAVYKDKG